MRVVEHIDPDTTEEDGAGWQGDVAAALVAPAGVCNAANARCALVFSCGGCGCLLATHMLHQLCCAVLCVTQPCWCSHPAGLLAYREGDVSSDDDSPLFEDLHGDSPCLTASHNSHVTWQEKEEEDGSPQGGGGPAGPPLDPAAMAAARPDVIHAGSLPEFAKWVAKQGKGVQARGVAACTSCLLNTGIELQMRWLLLDRVIWSA